MFFESSTRPSQTNGRTTWVSGLLCPLQVRLERPAVQTCTITSYLPLLLPLKFNKFNPPFGFRAFISGRKDAVNIFQSKKKRLGQVTSRTQFLQKIARPKWRAEVFISKEQ